MGAACGVSGTGEALNEDGRGVMESMQSLGSLRWEEQRMDKMAGERKGKRRKSGRPKRYSSMDNRERT